jgi:hypothetical protein
MKTHFADDATLAHIAELERENADLRKRLAMFEAITSSSQQMAVDRAFLKNNHDQPN